MTDFKIDGKLTTTAGDALADHARPLYDRLGATRIGIVELRSVERVTPAVTESKSPGVKLRIIGLEVANSGDQEDAIRHAQRTLHLQRTANGTLDETGQIELSERTLELTAGVLADIEVARLRAALEHWSREINKLKHSPAVTAVTDGKVRQEIKRIADGLDKALHPGRDDEEADETE